jgi:hypothetical protein
MEVSKDYSAPYRPAKHTYTAQSFTNAISSDKKPYSKLSKVEGSYLGITKHNAYLPNGTKTIVFISNAPSGLGAGRNKSKSERRRHGNTKNLIK